MLKEVKKYLDNHNILYVNHEHEPIFTSESGKRACSNIPGVHCKNLFMKDKKTKKLFLYTLPSTQRADLKKVAEKVGAKHFSMCSADLLMKTLKVKPGHVSPLCLIYKSSKDVMWIIDKKVWEASIVGFHPNENNQTLEMDKENFHRLVESFENEKHIVNVQP